MRTLAPSTAAPGHGTPESLSRSSIVAAVQTPARRWTIVVSNYFIYSPIASTILTATCRSRSAGARQLAWASCWGLFYIEA